MLENTGFGFKKSQNITLVKLYRLRRHNIQTSFWLIPPQKNKITFPLPRQSTNWSKNLRADQDLEPTLKDSAFSVAASSNTTMTYAQLQARLAQNWSLCRRLSTGCQKEPSLQTCLPYTYPTGSQTGTHEIGGTRRALLHPSRGRQTVIELLHPLKRATPNTDVPTTAPPSDKRHFA